MARWQQLLDAEPAFAKAVQARFDAHRHKTLATLRRDGSPRISGIEATFADGELWLGMMSGSRKAQDLRRDPRMALHSASVDPPEGNESAWEGDAKLSGVAIELTDEADREAWKQANGGIDPGPSHLFRVDIRDVTLTRVGEPADHLVIEHWREGEGLRRIKRA